ncbi:MAG: carboxymuconolactone decarboxylase family protein [Betaproteobacteria bacterium]|nr:carboxymuconolactone decarboxylase family protein [Betaproteobacteria bacterium]
MNNGESETPAAQGQRFKPIPLENLTAEQRVLADAIRSGPRRAVKSSAAARPGPLGGPFNVWLRSPHIGNIIQSLGAAIRFRSSLPPKLNELAILVTARRWTSQYEWFAHHRVALEAGLDPAIGEDIAQGRRPAKMSDDEAIVHDFSRELHETQRVSDATYQRALDRFGESGVVDLIAVNGYYVLVSMALNVDGTPLPDGAKPPLPQLKANTGFPAR